MIQCGLWVELMNAPEDLCHKNEVQLFKRSDRYTVKQMTDPKIMNKIKTCFEEVRSTCCLQQPLIRIT